MNPHATTALSALAVIEQPHLYAHRCTGGGWNRNGVVCPVREMLHAAHTAVVDLAGAPALAAQDAAAVKHVAWAATGLDLDQLGEEDRDGWGQTARDAILGLAGWLDENVPTPHPTPGVPVLDLHAADQEAEAVRYAAEVEAWHGRRAD